MSAPLSFNGFIKDVQYHACLADTLKTYNFRDFNINTVKTSGNLEFNGGQLAFSKWVSPKRTRSYPFERLYNTYNASKIITVIPVLKDEGYDGDLDRIQYSTISWMNLLNIYIVLTHYENAEKNTQPSQRHRHKLTHQKLNHQLVNTQIGEIIRYKQSALHWNRSLFEDRFTQVYQQAIDSYSVIAKRTSVQIHTREPQMAYLAKVQSDYQQFRDISLKGSQGAALREVSTAHELEYLQSGSKATFYIENYLGGIYYLTADEVLRDGTHYVIQESKNSTTGFLPAKSDIKDGLFKLILFANLDSLKKEGKPVAFTTRLKLTGNDVVGTLRFPCAHQALRHFLGANAGKLTPRQVETISLLRLEVTSNKNLEVEITGNR